MYKLSNSSNTSAEKNVASYYGKFCETTQCKFYVQKCETKRCTELGTTFYLPFQKKRQGFNDIVSLKFISGV